MDESRLLPVRCPGMVMDKAKGELVKCNKLCVKVYPGSSGEIQCRHCKLRFHFYVDSQAKSILSVKAKPVQRINENGEQSSSKS